MNQIVRRKFIKYIFAAFIFPVVWLWKKMVVNYEDSKAAAPILLFKDEIPNGISFHDKFFIIKKSSSIKVFSSKCSHLGCIIRNAEGNEFVCPCHGSKYNINGEAVRGPAQKPLPELKFKIDKKKIVVYAS
jgi:Rieske Fe-S protein